MDSKKCLFCSQLLQKRFEDYQARADCPNTKCLSKIFVIGNKIHYWRFPNLGIGTIIDIKKDSSHQNLYLVEFKNQIIKELISSDTSHYLFQINSKIKYASHKAYLEQKNKIKIGTIISRNLSNPKKSIIYEIINSKGKKIEISEQLIIGEYKNPLDEFSQGYIDNPHQFFLKIWGSQIVNSYASNSLKIITNSRLTILPYQISVGYQLINSGNARYLLADEVGLGKTIEAGIYVKEMIARKLFKRILIITPASLIGQWEFEMKNKFHLEFTRITSKFLKNVEIDAYSGGFFDKKLNKTYNLCTTTLQFARLSQCSREITSIEWDIVIFDEAHHLRRYLENAKTNRYKSTLSFDLAEILSKRTKSLLLLTATPIQLHSFDLFSLLELLNPYEFNDFQKFEVQRKKLAVFNLVSKNLRNFSRISGFERISLINQIMSLNLGYLEKELENRIQYKEFRHNVLKKVENSHFLSRYVIRNRRRRVFPNTNIKRIPQLIKVGLEEKELELYNRIHLYLAKIYSENFQAGNSGVGFVMVILQKLLTSSPPALISSLKKRINYLQTHKEDIIDLNIKESEMSEFTDEDSSLDINEGLEDYNVAERREIRKRDQSKTGKSMISVEFNINKHIKILKEFLKELVNLHNKGIDSKAKKLIEIVEEILDKNPNEKMIIFTQFKKTLFYLSEILTKKGYIVNEFHGGLDESNKNKSVKSFRNKGNVLLSTEIGGEGRNFQFCHIIINYDLPWNPMRLEQRIGRIDRIGQQHNVLIYNFYIQDTVESSIIGAITERIQIFKESIGELEPILGTLEKKITKIVLKKDDVPIKFHVDDLIKETQDNIDQVYDQLEDLILDKKSFQYEKLSKDFLNPYIISNLDLLNFIKLCSDYWSKSLNLELNSKRSSPGVWKISLNSSLQNQLLLDKPLYEGFFDLDLAKTNDELEFFALGHKVIMKLANLTSNYDFKGFSSLFELKVQSLLKKFEFPFGLRMDDFERSILKNNHQNKKTLNLFIFEVNFLGVIIERTIIPLLITDDNEYFELTSQLFTQPKVINDLIKENIINLENKSCYEKNDITLNEQKRRELYKFSLKKLKQIIAPRVKSIINENKEQYMKEKSKLLRTAEQKRKFYQTQYEQAKNNYRAKFLKKPTEKQLENAHSIENEKKRKNRLQYLKNIQKEIDYYENEMNRWVIAQDELGFDFPEQMKRLKKQKQIIVSTGLIAFAKIILR